MAQRRKTIRRRGKFARCHQVQCRFPIAWFSFRGGWRTFDPRAVDGRDHQGAAYPVEGKKAWLFEDLVVELMGRWSCSREEAEEHVYAMPWHVLHACPPPQMKKETPS